MQIKSNKKVLEKNNTNKKENINYTKIYKKINSYTKHKKNKLKTINEKLTKG